MKRPRRRRSSGDDIHDEPPSTSKKVRVVSDEEATLWAVATRALEPLKRAKPRVTGKEIVPPDTVLPSPEPDAGATKPRPSPGHHRDPLEAQPEAKKRQLARQTLPPKVQPSSPLPSTRQPPMADFERRVARKVAIGQMEIDARLDLHGMTQGAAQRRLRSFLRTAHSEGCRIVLVITGKGRETEAEPETFAEHMEKRERGVLKRSVPTWLEDPDMRAIVVSYTTASLQHGGSGALYVRLRRRAP